MKQQAGGSRQGPGTDVSNPVDPCQVSDLAELGVTGHDIRFVPYGAGEDKAIGV